MAATLTRTTKGFANDRLPHWPAALTSHGIPWIFPTPRSIGRRRDEPALLAAALTLREDIGITSEQVIDNPFPSRADLRERRGCSRRDKLASTSERRPAYHEKEGTATHGAA